VFRDAVPQFTQRNSLLRALPGRVQDRLQPDLVPVQLSCGQVLYEPGQRIDWIYFPTSSLISVCRPMKDGACAEIGVVGNDGVVGLSLLLGSDQSDDRAVVQMPGTALRLAGHMLVEEFWRSSALQRVVLSYTQALLMHISQRAACNRLHSVEQRLCRWLLLCLERAQGQDLFVTQEFIATMLGDRRETINVAERRLQSVELIRHSRGRISVLNRSGLESLACECYGALKDGAERSLTAQSN